MKSFKPGNKIRLVDPKRRPFYSSDWVKLAKLVPGNIYTVTRANDEWISIVESPYNLSVEHFELVEELSLEDFVDQLDILIEKKEKQLQ